MTSTVVLVVLSSVGLSLSGFFSLYLLNAKRWRSLANTLLGLLLLALTFRIGKAVFFNFLELPLYIKNLGLAANLAAGPLLFLYGKALFNRDFTLRPVQSLHFIPSLLYILLCWYIPNGTGDTMWIVSYALVLLQSYSYVALSLKLALRKQDGDTTNNWYLYLVLGLCFMWLIYGIIFLGFFSYHIAGAISFSLLMLFLASMALNKKLVFVGSSEAKYQQSRLSEREAQALFEQINKVILHDRLFLESDLNMSLAAEKVGLHSKVVSEVINRCEGKSFISYVNTFRIEEAKKLLRDKEANHKIAAVAFQCGFNSLSSFNSAFKNSTSQTPSQYRASQ